MSATTQAQETISLDEQRLIKEMKDIILKSLAKDYGSSKYHRRFHSKSTGLAKGTFVIDTRLSSHLQEGVFVPGRQYPCFVRFSNGSSAAGADDKRGVRGLAIKLLDVDGASEIKDSLGNTQDFVLTNNPILFPGTLEGQHIALQTLFAGWTSIFQLLRPRHLKGAITFTRSQIKCENNLNLQYFSGTSYCFGQTRAVKWVLQPVHLSKVIERNGASFLRNNLRQTLLENEFQFQFAIQLHDDASRNSIEDSAFRWRTPTIPVATLVLHRQDIDSPELLELDKTINFNPWHAVPEHKPLGGPNRFRKEYTALMKIRNQHNGH